MIPPLPKDTLHGVTLEQLLNKLVESYGWSGLVERILINYFRSDPSIKSSLKLLRCTPVRARRWKIFISTCSVWLLVITPGCAGATAHQTRVASFTNA